MRAVSTSAVGIARKLFLTAASVLITVVAGEYDDGALGTIIYSPDYANNTSDRVKSMVTVT